MVNWSHVYIDVYEVTQAITHDEAPLDGRRDRYIIVIMGCVRFALYRN
jgi:hypothetical protein